ncbi:MAG: D-alanyl-D-alanine carboxypeptidase/D-alanyl-D-alanine endopeptidase [Parachlamydiaceae bacterium]
MLKIAPIFSIITFAFASLTALHKEISPEMLKIMHQPKYEHSFWGIYVKDLQTGEIIYDLNSNKLFSPASTTKLFSVAALLNVFGDDYRFKTPVYTNGQIVNGQLQGDLILVAQGDLTMGGRESKTDTLDYTKLDHTIANDVPGVILTKGDPLTGINDLAKQVFQKGITEINGNIIIDDSLFDTTYKRDMPITPIIINENLIDITINPTNVDERATITWRPQIAAYTVENRVKTVSKNEPLAVTITSNDPYHIKIEGTIPTDQRDVVRTFSIKDPKTFARLALIQALEKNGIKVNLKDENNQQNRSLKSYQNSQQLALWTSPPLSEYAKLILKVSHNLGADLIPLLLASHAGKKTFNDGMRMIGDFAINEIKLSPNDFVFRDGAGGNENRLTPQAEIQLLEYISKQSSVKFRYFFDALPILGVDGSLQEFGTTLPAAGKVRAKPGTGVSFNLATGKYFLITQVLSGYIEGKNGHLFAYIVAVNNASMPTIEDVFAIFEDESQLSNSIYTEYIQSKK